MAKSKIKIVGSRKLFSSFKNGVNINTSVQGMKTIVEEYAIEALSRTPRNTGELQRSQEANLVVSKRTITGQISYDDPKAAAVHEVPANHAKADFPNNPSNAQHSYLKNALEDKDLAEFAKKTLQETLLKNKANRKKSNRVQRVLPKGREFTA